MIFQKGRRAFSRVDLVATILCALIVGFLVLMYLQSSHAKPRINSRFTNDSYQARGLHQAMLVWAQNNRDCYPLPSRVDQSNATVAQKGEAKDTTANIFSLLVFNGSVSPEIFYSPFESNPAIRVRDDYQYDDPKAAADPAHALWDPAFSADFTSAGGGNISYAHLQPSGGRLDIWSSAQVRLAFPPTPIIGTRGPQTAETRGQGLVENSTSRTILFFGTGTTWRGNMAFTDNHVEFLKNARDGTYTGADGKPHEDHLFYDEPDDAKSINSFLGIFIKAGAKPNEFKAIWD